MHSSDERNSQWTAIFTKLSNVVTKGCPMWKIRKSVKMNFERDTRVKVTIHCRLGGEWTMWEQSGWNRSERRRNEHENILMCEMGWVNISLEYVKRKERIVDSCQKMFLHFFSIFFPLAESSFFTWWYGAPFTDHLRKKLFALLVKNEIHLMFADVNLSQRKSRRSETEK